MAMKIMEVMIKVKEVMVAMKTNMATMVTSSTRNEAASNNCNILASDKNKSKSRTGLSLSVQLAKGPHCDITMERKAGSVRLKGS